MANLSELIDSLASNKWTGKGQLILSKELKNDDVLGKLCSAINKNSSVTSVDLSMNNIGDKGASEIAKLLDKNKTIVSINLQKNKIGLHGAQAIQKALINNNTTLTHLDLSDQAAGGKGDDKEAGRELKRVLREVDRLVEANLNMHKCAIGEGVIVDLGGRGLTEIDIPFLSKFPNVQQLHLNDNKISEIPEGITQFQHLKELNLAYNNIELVPNFIGKLTNLTVLDLRHNKISALPTELSNIPNLTTLRFTSNKSDNKSSHSVDLLELDAEDNPDSAVGQVPIPREVIHSDGTDLISYVRETKRGLRTQHRVKVMLLGVRGVGKTSLANYLFELGEKPNDKKSKKELPPPSPTHGVVRHWVEFKTNVVPKKYNNTMVVCLYDCAGDSLSVQYMFSGRTVYMLLFNLLEPEEEKSRLEYYLHYIHKSVKSPVIIMLIGTHADDKRCTSSYKKKLFQNMAQEWNDRYPYLKHMTAVDARSGKGISELRERFVGYISSYKWLPQNIPRGYLSVEVGVSSKSYSESRRPVMSMKSFEQLVVKARCSKESAVSLAKFLTDLGVVVYSDPWIILDPAWLAESFSEVPFALRRQKEVTVATEPSNDVEAAKQVKSLLIETDEVIAEYDLILSVLKNEKGRRIATNNKNIETAKSSSSAKRKGGGGVKDKRGRSVSAKQSREIRVKTVSPASPTPEKKLGDAAAAHRKTFHTPETPNNTQN